MLLSLSLMCENLIFRTLTVRTPWYAQNGDGLDLESCRNVLIYQNTFDVGDDAICLTSGKNEDGRRRGMPTENVIVSHNVVYHGHGGFVIGSEMSGGVRNVKGSFCPFMGTDVGLRFKSTRGRGGVVEDIYISEIDMTGISTEAIRFNLFYGGNSPTLEGDQRAETEARDARVRPVTEETPAFRNIHLGGIRVTRSKVAATFQGLPEMNLHNITLTDASFDTEQGITVIDGDSLTFRRVSLHQQQGPRLIFYNTRHVVVSQPSFQQPNEPKLRVLGPLTQKIQLTGTKGDNGEVVAEQGASLEAVSWE